MFLKRNLNYIRLYLNKGKIGISMLITHEQGVLRKFLGLGSLKQIFGNFPLSYPGSKKHRTEAFIHVPRMFNHTHSNNMINR
jgi:hypothetical protein